MGVRQRILSDTARQLGRPEGWRGRILARALNRENRQFVAAAVEATGLQRGTTGADVGFGGGIGLELLMHAVGPSGHVEGVDLSDTIVAAAKSRFADECASGRLSVHRGSVLDLPLADGSVDGVITVNTIYFVDDLPAALVELLRVLRPGGRVVVGIGDPDSMAKMSVTAHGFRLRPAVDVLAAMSAAGFVDSANHEFGQGDRKGHLLIGLRPG